MYITYAQMVSGKLIIDTTDKPEAGRFAMNFQPGEYEIAPVRKKRSLDANAYLWVLIGKMADMLHNSKDDIYLLMLKRYGQGGVVKLRSKDVDLFKRQYKYCEEHEKIKPEADAAYYRFWLGSSQYSPREMNILLDGTISECQDLGIETLTPEEISKLKSAWEAEYGR